MAQLCKSLKLANTLKKLAEHAKAETTLTKSNVRQFFSNIKRKTKASHSHQYVFAGILIAARNATLTIWRLFAVYCLYLVSGL